jgi:aminomethyltransferase
MGRTRIAGHGSTALLQELTTNNVAELQPFGAHYSLLTNTSGGIIDDIIVYRSGAEEYLVVINAANAEKDLAWIRSKLRGTVTIEDRTEETAMIAVQGPDAPLLIVRVTGDESLLGLDRFQYGKGTIAGTTAICCRTGYTGEDGFELIVPAGGAVAVWHALREAGAVPCGLGARDALRIEAGYPLYGHEIDEVTTPVEAGLMWVVRLDKGDFIGRTAIEAARSSPVARRLVGLRCTGRVVPRQGYTIFAGDETAGCVTSGIFSPTLETSVAMGYVTKPFNKTGTSLTIGVRDKRLPAVVVPKKALLARD